MHLGMLDGETLIPAHAHGSNNSNPVKGEILIASILKANTSNFAGHAETAAQGASCASHGKQGPRLLGFRA